MRDVTPMTQKATDGRPEMPGLEAGLSVCRSLSFCLSTIFSENRFTLCGIVL